MPTYNDSALTYDAGTTSYDGDPGAIPGLPQCVIEIGFDDGPYVSEPYWADVTEYVRAVTVRRGRSDDLSPFVGTATVELDNRDRRFDPFNTSSVYYGKLLPRRQIRIRAAAGATTYPVFRGYVAGWPVSYTDAGFDSTVTVECFDALAFVAAETTPDTWLSDYTTSLTPLHYYRMNDPVSSQTATGIYTAMSEKIKDTGSRPMDIQRYFLTVASTGGIIEASSSAIDISAGVIQTEVLATVQPVASRSLSAFVQLNTQATLNNVGFSDGVIMAISYQVASGALPNRLIYEVVKGAGGSDLIQTYFATTIADSQTIHVGMTFDSSTNAIKAYYNGEDVTGATTTATGFAITSTNVSVLYAKVAEYSIFDTVLTAANMRLLYQYGQQNLSEQVPSRMTRIFRTTPFPENASPSGDFNIWEAPLATQFIRGLQSDNPISSEIAVMNSGEGGELFTSREGVIYLTGRDTQNYSSAFLPYDPVTPQVTFSDQAGTALLPFSPSLDVEYNADDIINDLSVSFTGGGSIVVTDTTSISANGKRSATITTNLTGPTGAGSPQDLAANRLEYFRHVIPKVSPVDVGMTRRLTDWQRLLDLELMDCFSVQRTPSVGSALDFRLQVQVIEHQIVQGDWRMRVTGSARYSNWFTADVDSADGDRLAV